MAVCTVCASLQARRLDDTRLVESDVKEATSEAAKRAAARRRPVRIDVDEFGTREDAIRREVLAEGAFY